MSETIEMKFEEVLQIDVEAGKTHVLDIEVRPVDEPGLQPDLELGSLYIRFKGPTGDPMVINQFYLIGTDSIMVLNIDNAAHGTGVGIIEDIPPGEYTVSLQLAAFYFGPGGMKEDSITHLNEIGRKLVNSDISKIECVGFRDDGEDEVVSKNRAESTKEMLETVLRSELYKGEEEGNETETETEGMPQITAKDGGDVGTGENEEYRRVDLYAVQGGEQ